MHRAVCSISRRFWGRHRRQPVGLSTHLEPAMKRIWEMEKLCESLPTPQH